MSNLPIQFQDKINSPELLAFLQQFGEETYVDAELINKFRDAINELHARTADTRIVEKTGLEIVGTDVIIEALWKWLILSVQYSNDEQITLPITLSSIGNQKLCYLCANQDNGFELVYGPESETNPAAPTIEGNLLYITFFLVTDGTVGTPAEPIIGDVFKKKSEAAAYNDPTLTGANAVIPLQPNGQSFYAFSNARLTSIDGFGLSLITGNPSAEVPYDGKDIFIFNNKAGNLTLKHDGSGSADVKFALEGGVDLVIPAGGKVWLKYGHSYCEVIFKSWIDVDLSTKADLVRGKVPASQLPAYVDDVLEFANLAAFPVTGETSKIYLALDTNKTYRWTGSVYVQIGGGIDLYPIKYWYQATGVGMGTYGTNVMLIQGTQTDVFVPATCLSYRKIVSATTAGTSISARESSFFRVLLNKGFQFLLRFRIADAATISDVRGFHGLQVTSYFGNTDISANVQPMCGIGCDGTDTNIHIFSRKSIFETLVKIDTGFSKTLNHEYLLTQERLPNSNDVVFTLKNLTTSTEFTSTVVNNSYHLTIVNHRNNNASTLSCGFEIQRQELNLSE